MLFFFLSRIPLSDVLTVRFITKMSDAELVVEESKSKHLLVELKPKSSELINEVFFSCFNNKLEGN